MSKSTIVSVCMITYAHEKFIREAIEGVLMQDCDCEVELIIANDCSPDNTDEVIKDILNNHPKAHWIKYIKHKENKGMMPNFIYALQQCKGKYIALCEGDDYLTDPLKLQKQVCFLEKNEEYVLCFHSVKILQTDGKLVNDFITKVPGNYETQEILARFGNYIHTPSVVFRNIIKEFPFEFSLTPIGDYLLYMLLAEKGKLQYSEEKMAVYRYNVGVISRMSNKDISSNNVKMYSCMIGCLKHENIKRIILDKQISIVNQHYELIESKYKDAFISHHFIFIKIKFFIKEIKKRFLKLR